MVNKLLNLLNLVILPVFIVLVAWGIIVIQQNTQALKKQATQLQAQQDAIKKTADEVNSHIDCIVLFLAQPNRAGLSINDVQNCSLKDMSQPSGSTSVGVLYIPRAESSRVSGVQNDTTSSSNFTPTPQPVQSKILQPQPTLPDILQQALSGQIIGGEIKIGL